jgi:hypothetical protein
MVDRNSGSYKVGKFVGRVGLIFLGYLLGKRWGRRPINDFPQKPD